MQWAVIKYVTTDPLNPMLGCIVGPFPTEDAAVKYGELASRFCLGYEKWIARELQTPNVLERSCPPI